MDNMVNLKEFVKNGKKIVAAAVNYKSVLVERNIPTPKKPVIFLKPTSSYITTGQNISIPEGWTVAQETELGVIIGNTCRKVMECEAMKYVGGYCLALDMTALSEMTKARQTGLPWTIGKGFDTACPVSRLIDLTEIKDPHNLEIWCKVNGQLRQQFNTNDLIFNIPQLISYISETITLEPNDLILTGTSTGVLPVKKGDVIESGIKDVVNFEFHVE